MKKYVYKEHHFINTTNGKKYFCIISCWAYNNLCNLDDNDYNWACEQLIKGRHLDTISFSKHEECVIKEAMA